jgi:glucan phosphoethanolaminetransferase (alkaline phosphatase superfamily)
LVAGYFGVVHSVSSRRIAWQAAAFSGAHLIVALLIVAALSSYVHFGRRGLLFHALLLTGGVWAGWLAVLFAIRRQRPLAKAARVVFTAMATAATSALLLLYLGAYVGNRAWGACLNYRIVLAYWALMVPNTAPLYIPWSVHISAAIATVALFAWYWWSWRLVAPSAAALAVSVRPTIVLGTTLAWFVATTAAGLWFAQTGALGREPVAGFFFTADDEYDFDQYSLDRQLAADAVEARGSYPRGQSFTKRNVILIVVDALRADHMGIYGYERATTPFLSSLAASGRLQKVDLALASCAESSCGIASILTSKSFRHLSTPNFSLAGLLEDQGYDVYQLLSGDHNWGGIRKAYGKDQKFYFDSSDSKRYRPMTMVWSSKDWRTCRTLQGDLVSSIFI